MAKPASLLIKKPSIPMVVKQRPKTPLNIAKRPLREPRMERVKDS